MCNNYSTFPESLHLNIEQRRDFYLEEQSSCGGFRRIEFSEWKRLSVSICRENFREKGFKTTFQLPEK